ncbi:MAG: hypothetical protein HY430_00415 [Candidatus Levybacteria bacterium]|nr:hypothetical protein [Candidatus Levybacteria bacterium]
MEPQPPEQGKPTPELVHLNQDFALFAPHRLVQWQVPGVGVQLSQSSIELSPAASMLDLSPIPITFLTEAPDMYYSSNLVFTPFDHEKGLIITEKDYSEERLTKTWEEAAKMWPAEYPLLLGSHSGMLDELARRGLRTSDNLIAQFTPAMQEFVQGLRLLIFFPGFTFEGVPDRDEMGEGRLEFNKFYPLDWGPFKEIKDHFFPYSFPLHEGAPMAIPEGERLQQIRGKFIYRQSKATEEDTQS